ncbi:flagellar basal body rod protein FlgB [Clostridium rectalis]|uniref:flagellar basal body rod protein FlgB n=1 Tax=Clostridium rectalis TaxID=2040295 RepID=UPI000F6381EB|nr:flagellar basal body rod protein FlgB [Clostridium rectalis]
MKVQNMALDSKNYDLIKKELQASSIRGRVISNNLSNINTKGYKRRYVKFEDTLKESLNNLELRTTNNKHLNTGEDYGSIKVEQDKVSSMREDGNNVDLDIEKVNQAANALMYNTMISQLNNRLSTKRYIINGR